MLPLLASHTATTGRFKEYLDDPLKLTLRSGTALLASQSLQYPLRLVQRLLMMTNTTTTLIQLPPQPASHTVTTGTAHQEFPNPLLLQLLSLLPPRPVTSLHPFLPQPRAFLMALVSPWPGKVVRLRLSWAPLECFLFRESKLVFISNGIRHQI